MNQEMTRRFTRLLLSAVLTVTVLAGCSAQNAATQTGLVGSGNSVQAESGQDHPGLLDPSKANEKSPDNFLAKFHTTQGDFTIEVTRRWAPNGADRFYNMIRVGYFKDIAIFRAVDGFMFQFGIHGTPAVAAKWSDSNIMDDRPVGKSNIPGTISFAQTGRPNTRSVQMFVNLGNNATLDTQRVPFVPFGKVVEGMDVIKKINTEYGENPRGEDIQGKFKRQGNAYIRDRFPNIDFIKSVEIIPVTKGGK